MHVRAFFGRATAGALVLLMTVGLVPEVAAQPQPGMGTSVVFRPAPRELTLRLSRARKAIDAEDYTEAVLELGRLLTELEQGGAPDGAENAEQQDYFVGPRGEGTHVSLKTEAQRLIGSMPAKGREWYEVQFGPEARQLLEKAAEDGDVTLLSHVSRRYFHTKAGYEATLLLGRHYLDSGSPLAAALAFRRLGESPAANDFEPELSVLTATCWLHSNAPDRAQQTLAALVKKMPAARLRVGGSDLELPRDEVRAREQLESLLALRRLERGGPLLEWTLYRGDATRTARVVGDAPLTTARWRLPTANDPNDEQLVEQIAKRYIAQGITALPSVQPLAVQDFVLMRTTEGMWGVDMRTGKRRWPFPWVDMESSGQLANGRVFPPGVGTTARETELRQRLFEDAPFGQMSSDGQVAYLLDGLNFANQANMNQGPFIIARPGVQRTQSAANQLVALDVKREGKLLWVVGDSQGNGGDEPRLAGAFFLGPPLPLHGKLYVMAEINSEVRLVVLDSKTGALEWQQQLAQLESRSIQFDMTRRLSGASPSFADGVLICPTSAGAVVAIDVATRSLLWGFQYSAQNNPEGRNAGPFFGRVMNGNPPKPIGQRWMDATATIHEGRVLITPVESDEMYCLDLLTGKLLWPAQKRNDLIYVATVSQGNAILVGKNHVLAVRLADGKPVWANPVEIPEGGMPSGRGFHAGDEYFLPTTNQLLLRIDLKEGKIAQRVRTDRVLGNLICFRDEIISHAPDGMSVYPMVRPLRDRVAQMLKQAPDDPWALARSAELAAYDGERERALEILRAACQKHPGQESLRILLVNNLMLALREDFPRYRGLARELEQLIEQPPQREQFLRLMAAGLRQVGEGDAAFDMLLKLVDLESTRSPEGSSAMEELATAHSVRRERWSAARLADFYRNASPTQKRRADELLLARRDEAEKSGQIWGLKQYLRNFGFHPLSLPLRVSLANRLIDSEAWLEAQILLASLEEHPDRALAGSAVAATARLLLQSRQPELAATYYWRLATQFGDTVCAEGLTGAALAEAAVNKDVTLQKAWLQQKQGWPYGRVNVEEREDVSLNRANYSRIVPVSIRERMGASPPEMTLSFDSQKNYSLLGKDGLGRDVFATTLLRPDGGISTYYFAPPQTAHAKMLGQLVVAHMGLEVVALSSLRGGGRSEEGIRWRTDIVSRMGDSDQTVRTRTRMTSTSWGWMKTSVLDHQDRVIGNLGPCTATGVVFQKQKELVCVDPLRGDIWWTRNDLPPSCELFGDEEFVFVIPPDSKEMLVLDMIDGRTIATRPVDPADIRWTTCGRRVLAWTENRMTSEKTVRLYDAWTGQTLYEQKCPSTARGTVLDDRLLGFIQNDGLIRLVSLVDGQVVAQTQGEPESTLIGTQLMASSDGYLFIASTQPRGTTGQVEQVGGSGGPIVNGRVYAFDRRTGKVRWPVPATFEQFGLISDQPSLSPLLTLIRKKGGMQSSLLCLDKRDGRVVYLKDDVPVQANFTEVIVRPEQNEVAVALGTRTYVFTLTAEPIPPETPAQLGSSASTLPGIDRNEGGLLNSIFGAFGRGVKSRSAEPKDPQP